MGENAEASLEKAGRSPGRKGVFVVGVLTVLLAVVTVWTVPRPTGDLYVALAAGRDILNGRLTKLDDWSFSTAGRVWVNQNWGTHLLYYLFYRAFGGKEGHLTGGVPDGEDSGEIGLVVLKLLILLTGATFLTLACHRRGTAWPIALIVAGGVIAAGRSFIDLRPNLTTLMFVPVMLHLLYRTAEKPRRIWLVMVVFGLLWANLHGGFFLGLMTMGFWSLCMIVPPMLREKPLRKLMLGFVWAAAAGLIGWAFAVEGGYEGKSVFLGACLGAAALALHVIHTLKRRLAGAKPGEARAEYRAAFAASVGPRWQYLAATAGAFVLAGVVTPFGVHNLFRDYSKLSMPFWEIWNLSHPFVVMAGADSELWQSVIEWHSIFTASPRTFGTSWEFFGIVGLFAVLVPLHVTVKLAKRRAVNLEDLVLVVGMVVLAVAVTAQAQPMWGKFAPFVDLFSRSPALKLQLAGVLEQRHGWMAVMIVYPLIGLFSAGVGVAAGAQLLFGKRQFERFSAGRIGMMIFEVVMAAGGIYLAFGARRFIPLSLILLAPLLARRVQWLLTSLGRLWPTLVAGVAVLVVIGVQAHTNLMRYLPYSPLVRNRSMLRNMIVYRMFPPGPRDFLYDNDMEGRVFNEWRWEGYLRWYCPGLKMYLGGRAQQVYDVETYKLQRRILGGRELPSVLEEMKIRWIVVPMNPGYAKLLHAAVYARAARWVSVYCDGENIVLANSRLPECQEAIRRCIGGRLKYRDPAVAALSRAVCFSSRRVGAAKKAIAALKESHRLAKDRPIFQSYSSLGDLYKKLPVNTKAEIAYFEAENRRLAGLDYHWGRIEVLRCRQWVLNMLASLYKADKNPEKFDWARNEMVKIGREVEAVVDKWR